MAEFIPRIQPEVVVHDEMVDEVVNVIQKVAHTGNAERLGPHQAGGR